MRGRGALTLRHLVVAVLVVIVVNTQLTWWIVFVLRENRTRLELEREGLAAACRIEADRVAAALDDARLRLLAVLESGLAPGEARPPRPFAGWRTADAADLEAGWRRDGDRLEVVAASGRGAVVATAAADWARSLTETPARLEVVDEAAARSEPIVFVKLPAPFAGLVVRPTPEVWQAALEGYRSRIVMMVSEGTFFAVLLFVLIALLVIALRREVQLERRHRNFLAAITHELKSPLAALRLSLETVLSGRADGPAGRRFLANALGDVQRLESLIQKVLQVTRYDDGGETMRRGPASLTRLVGDTVAAFARGVGPLGASVTAELADDVWAEVDSEGLAIVVSNLLENAVKYGGSEPRVRVTLGVEGGRAVLEVEDNGAGVPADELPYIFDRFYRAGDEMTRTTNGTGLGLYLVKQIVTAHRGTVGVVASGPTGTRFRVTLPDVAHGEVGS